jgi:hypothetical protein
MERERERFRASSSLEELSTLNWKEEDKIAIIWKSSLLVTLWQTH